MIRGVRVMGIVNVTPDSFSDGGKWLDHERAIRHGRDLIAAGADIIDVGGESTRPGASRVAASVEQDRVLPVIRGLVGRGAQVSVDTLNASTALRAVEAGADIINDVSGGLADPAMLASAAQTGAQVVLMHWRGRLVAGETPEYDDVVTEVRDHLSRRLEAATAQGIAPHNLILDPGLGFSKTAEHNWAILRQLHRFVDLGVPLLVGASRKRFIAELTGATDVSAESLAIRDAATAAISVHTAASGGWGVRVHDVAGTVAALRTWDQLAVVKEDAHV